MKRILHVGCGGSSLPPWLPGEEIRLDIDERASPHIVASMLDMGDIGEFDVVYTSHTLEHVYPHEVPVALSECRRVLKTGGALILMVPNLDGVQATEDVLYQSASGPVTGIDMIYGARWLLKDMPFMAHHTGFVPETLYAALENAGFHTIQVKPLERYNLLGAAQK